MKLPKYVDTFKWIAEHQAQADITWINGHRRIVVLLPVEGGYVVDDQTEHESAFVFRAIVSAIVNDPLRGKTVQWNPGCAYAI